MTTVLIVDDDWDVRLGLSSALAEEGYAVCEARNGEEALQLLTSRAIHPHVVLLDMMMPRMDGVEFLAEVALRPELHALPIIVISTYRNAALRGVREFMEKPVDLDALLSVIAKVCHDVKDAA